MAPQSSTLLLRASLDAYIPSLSEPATSAQLDFEWHSVQIDCHVQKDSSDVSRRKLFFLISFHSDGKSNTKKLHLPFVPTVSPMKRDATSRLLADIGMAGCPVGVSVFLCRRRRFSPRKQRNLALKLPPQ